MITIIDIELSNLMFSWMDAAVPTHICVIAKFQGPTNINRSKHYAGTN